MGTLTEELIYCPKIRLFRWNEKHVDKKNLLKDSYGLCLFDIISSVVARTNHTDSRRFALRRAHNRCCDRVTTFELDRLLSAVAAVDDDDDHHRHDHQDSMLQLATTLVTGTSLFSTETAAELGKQIFTHFTGDFHQLKDSRKLFGSSIGGGPGLVMVIQIRLFRWFEYIGTEPHLPPVDDSLINHIVEDPHEEEEPSSESDKDDEYLEKWAPGEVRWYDYSDEAAAYWLGLRNYLGEPTQNNNLLTKPITKEEPRGIWEIPPTSLALRHRRSDGSEEAEAGEEDEEIGDKLSCSICLNGFVIDNLDNMERTICSHVFHRACIWNWLYRINSCPVCRRSLPLLSSNICVFSLQT